MEISKVDHRREFSPETYWCLGRTGVLKLKPESHKPRVEIFACLRELHIGGSELSMDLLCGELHAKEDVSTYQSSRILRYAIGKLHVGTY